MRPLNGRDQCGKLTSRIADEPTAAYRNRGLETGLSATSNFAAHHLFNRRAGLLGGVKHTHDFLASIDCSPITDLGQFVENLVTAKFDGSVPPKLLRQHGVSRHAKLALEVTGLIRTLSEN